MELSPVLIPFINSKIIRPWKGTSSYTPSSLMMDYIIHQINTALVHNFHFRRASPNYHPYILRLYYAILFWIQCMRASHHATQLNSHAHIAFTFFLHEFPPESLPISSPLLGLFKTLCCSKPEIPNYAYLYPAIPSQPGPHKRHEFMRHEPQSYVMPKRYGDFGFPTLADDDDLSSYVNFLHFNRGLAWFANVKIIADYEASFFKGSGTLADCEPFGIAANQVVVQYLSSGRGPTPPMYSADSAGLFPFSIRLKTTARSLPELAEPMAATFQTNVDMPYNLPFLNGVGAGTQQGPFWKIRPEEYSPINESSYLQLYNVIHGLMKSKG